MMEHGRRRLWRWARKRQSVDRLRDAFVLLIKRGLVTGHKLAEFFAKNLKDNVSSEQYDSSGRFLRGNPWLRRKQIS